MRVRHLLVALSAVAALGAGCGGDADEPTGDGDPAATVDGEIVIAFVDGEPAEAVRREDAALGSTVEIRLDGSTDEQVHVHGYDLYIEPGEESLVFDALIPGRFEIELEESGRLLVELTVS